MGQRKTIEIDVFPLCEKANAVLHTIDGFGSSLYDETDFASCDIVFNQEDGLYSIITYLEFGEVSNKIIGNTEDDVVTYLINDRIRSFAGQGEDREEDVIKQCNTSLLNNLSKSQYLSIVSPIVNKSFVLENNREDTSFSLSTSRSWNNPVVLCGTLCQGSNKMSVMFKDLIDIIDKIADFQHDFGNSFLALQLGIPTTLVFDINNAKIIASVEESEILWHTELEDLFNGKCLTNEFKTEITALKELMDFFYDFILYQGVTVPR